MSQHSASRLSSPSPRKANIRLLRVLVVGPELLACALNALLSTVDDLSLLSPISDPDQVVPFVQRIGSTDHPIDVTILHWSGNLESDHSLLEALSALGNRCLVVTSLVYPNELEFIQKAGAWGYFFTASSLRQLATALRTIAQGQKYFPEPASEQPPTSSMPLAYLRIQRQLVFHRDRLEELARKISWPLSETDYQIFYNFADSRVDEIAGKVHMRPTSVRRELSERIYQFLKLVSGRPIPSRFVAFQVLQEFGVLEYIIASPPR